MVGKENQQLCSEVRTRNERGQTISDTTFFDRLLGAISHEELFSDHDVWEFDFDLQEQFMWIVQTAASEPRKRSEGIMPSTASYASISRS